MQQSRNNRPHRSDHENRSYQHEIPMQENPGNTTDMKKYHITRLYKASMKGDLKTVELEINDYNFKAKDDQGNTPLHIASVCGKVEVAEKLLISNPKDISEMNVWMQTPLHMAAAEGHYEVVEKILYYARQDGLLVRGRHKWSNSSTSSGIWEAQRNCAPFSRKMWGM
uniref:26S proteasome non-ATPase regulatory subunit 10-like n=1 Tax=Styela clava TaxID=7725 RepID=UPI00193AA4E1|nr:26S proteasome non-ATPase regulatory subunit 10-like [Styela clava]